MCDFIGTVERVEKFLPFPYSRLDVFDIRFGATRIFFITQWCGCCFLFFFALARFVPFVIRGEAVLCERASNNIFSNTMDLLLLVSFGGANVCVCDVDVCASLNVVCNSLRFMEIVLGIIFCWRKKKEAKNKPKRKMRNEIM